MAGPRRSEVRRGPPPLRIAVLGGGGDRAGALDQALGVLAPEVLGIEVEDEHFDLSLGHRRATGNAIVHKAVRAMRACGLGFKAATVTPDGRDDVGSPNRILRDEVGAR